MSFDAATRRRAEQILASMPPSPAEVDAARTAAGGWKREQLAAWGIPWPPPRGWRQRLARAYEQAVAGV